MDLYFAKRHYITSLRFTAIIGLLLISYNTWANGEVTEISTFSEASDKQQPVNYLGSDGNTYMWGQGNETRIESFIYNEEKYDYKTLADKVVIERVNNPNAEGTPCGIFAQTTGTVFQYEPSFPSADTDTYNCDLAGVMAGRIINRGVLNVFMNTGTAAKNIERVDFIFSSGIVSPDKEALLEKAGHVVMEKSGNNPVKIAAIRALDAAGRPSVYGPLILVNTVTACAGQNTICYGLAGPEIEYDFLANNPKPDSNLNPSHGYVEYRATESERPGIAFVSLKDLGVEASRRYYGFSYFAADVDEVNHTLSDPATFPRDTATAAPGDPVGTGPGGADIYGGTAGYFELESPDGNITTGLKGHGAGSTGWFLVLVLFFLIVYRYYRHTIVVKGETIKRLLAHLMAVFVASLTLQSTAYGEESPDDREFDRRIYLGANIGASKVNPDVTNPIYLKDDNKDFGGSLFLGYDLSKHWSIEGFATDLGETGINHASDNQRAGSIGYRNYGLSAIGYFYNQRDNSEDEYDDEGYFLREGWSLFGRIGYGKLENSSSLPYEQLNGTQVHLGAGVEHGWSNGFAFRTEFISYDEDIKFISVGLLKRFGEHQKPQPENQPPTAVDDSVTIEEEQTVTIDILANDYDADADSLSFTVLTDPLNGTQMSAENGITYIPANGFSGTDNFTYQLSDGRGGTDTGNVKITVVALNRPPTAVDDSVTIEEGQTVTIDILANDYDADSDPLSFTVLTDPLNGTRTLAESSITYTPDNGFFGIDNFTYQLSDGQGGVDTGHVKITVVSLPIIYFDFDKADPLVSENAVKGVNRIVEQLKGNTDLRIEIQGHTDLRGSAEYNERLSTKRAEEVQRLLVEKGVPIEQINPKGYGETQPIVNDETEEAGKINRRVEFKQHK